MMPEHYIDLAGKEQFDPLDRHHVFGGPNRKKSEKYGAVVLLHHNACHIFGPLAVHNHAGRNTWIKRRMQQQIMREQHWDMDRWIQEFGKNYLPDGFPDVRIDDEDEE